MAEAARNRAEVSAEVSEGGSEHDFEVDAVSNRPAQGFDREAAHYIAEMTAGLSGMAEAARMTDLAGLLRIAQGAALRIADAAEEAEADRPASSSTDDGRALREALRE